MDDVRIYKRALSESEVAQLYAYESSTQDIGVAPLAQDQSVTGQEDQPLAITLTGNDADDDALNYTVVEGPSHGSLSGEAPNLI